MRGVSEETVQHDRGLGREPGRPQPVRSQSRSPDPIQRAEAGVVRPASQTPSDAGTSFPSGAAQEHSPAPTPVDLRALAALVRRREGCAAQDLVEIAGWDDVPPHFGDAALHGLALAYGSGRAGLWTRLRLSLALRARARALERG